MSDMMQGWEKSALKDACLVFTDGNWIESKDQSADGIRLVQTGNIGFGFYKDKKDKARFISEETFARLKCTEILPNDLLVSRLPDPVGKSCIIPNINCKMITGVDCTVVRTKDSLLSEFLLYYQMSDQYLYDVNSKVSGTTRSRISRKNLGLIEIPLPPIPEQQRIVAILDKAFAAIAKAKANAEQNLKNARELFESYLQGVFTDKRWERKNLGDLCERVEYGSSKKSLKEGVIPVLRMGNIQNGRLVWDKLVYSDDAEENRRYLLKYNDVLFNRTNSPELVGKTAIYKNEMPAIFAGYLIRIHRKDNLLDADYLNYYLNSEMAMEYGKTVVISSVNQANINGTKLKGYPIPCPTLEEQQNIALKLDALSTETNTKMRSNIEDIF